jgi:sugar phosphate permease
MKNKALMLVSLSAFGLNGSQMALNTYLVLFAHQKLGISLALSGLLLVISEVSGSAGRIVWGVASDALFQGNRVMILLIIAVLAALSSLGVAFASQASFWEIIPLIILFGFSLSGFNGIWMNLASEIVNREQSGISSGLSLSLGSLGVIVVPPVFGLLVDRTGSFAYGWLFIAVIMVFVVAMLCCLALGEKRERLNKGAG